MDAALTASLEDFKKTATQLGEEVAFKHFPQKLLELQKLIESTKDPKSPYHPEHIGTLTDATVYPPPPPPTQNGKTSKKRKLEDGAELSNTVSDTQHARYPETVYANKHLPQLHSVLKKECEDLIALTDKVKLWISLTMPKIEGGDNFGVQIQEEVVSELARSQESAVNLRDSARNDYLARAKICAKLIKYPNIEDYALALKEHDDNQFYLARQHLTDLRNLYAVLTDLIHKNIAKIRAPKGNGGMGLY
ncbi:PA28-beta domain-containing protein [Mycena kentingensis (nom. inval.)]|nr:PA28-beta domain-containing protein [Mycena kentingensis (nom. inval.)]